MMDKHTPHESIAALADGMAIEDRDATLKHLARCSRCLGIYLELLNQRARWLDGRTEGGVPEDVLRMGIAVAHADVPANAGTTRPRRTPAWWPGVSRLTVAAAAAVVVSVAVFVFAFGEGRRPRFVRELSEEIERAAVMESASGLAISASATSRDAPTRSGAPGPSRPGDADMARLAAYYNTRSMSPDIAYTLVLGYLMTGKLRNADAYLSEALDLFPADDRLEMLAGVLAYTRSDLDGAERHLRAALALRPRAAVVRFNLGVVLSEEGRHSEAEPYLREAEEALRGTPIGTRARELLSGTDT